MLVTEEFKKDYIKHLKLREGVIHKSYKDSLGKLTGGVGHLLTGQDALDYPLGSSIPVSVVDKWLLEDSEEALDAALKQVLEIGVYSEHFLMILASVNFQLSVNWHKKFVTAYKHLKNHEWERAIAEIEYVREGSSQKSLWNIQSPTRVSDFVGAIRLLQS